MQNLNFALRKPTDLLAQLLLTKRFVEAKYVGKFTHVIIFYLQMSFKSMLNLLTGFVSVPLMSKLLITSVLITSFLEENFNDKSTN